MADLQWAVRNGEIETLKTQTFNVNEDEGGKSLLVSAADYGQVEVIEFLIKKGASVNKADVHGITPLLAAIYENHVEAARTLIKNGAKKDGTCPDGSSYLDAASSSEMKDLLK